MTSRPVEPQRIVYNKDRASYSPYQNQNPTTNFGKKKYLINAPRPGMKWNNFRGIETLTELKKTAVTSKRSMVEDVPILLQSRNRRVIKFIPRVISESTSTTVSIHDNVGAVQEVTTEDDDAVTKLEKRKINFGVSCSECSLSFYSRLQLCNHASTAHGIPAPVIRKVFEKEEVYLEWLNLIKRSHAVDFVNSSGSKNYNGSQQKITYLQCSRSGEQKVLPNRNVKKPRGSMKCGKTCLAYIKVTQSLRHERPWGPIKVEGCLSHSGHMIDPEKIILVAEEERAIQQLMERNRSSSGPIDITMARAILYPCSRFRLITDDNLLLVLPRWMWQIRNEQEVHEEGWNGNELDVEREEEGERRIPHSTRMDETFHGLGHQILDFDDSDDFVSVV